MGAYTITVLDSPFLKIQYYVVSIFPCKIVFENMILLVILGVNKVELTGQILTTTCLHIAHMLKVVFILK